MTDHALSAEDIQALIDYARRKFEMELYPFAPALRPVRDALEKLHPKPKPRALPPAGRYASSTLAKRKRRR